MTIQLLDNPRVGIPIFPWVTVKYSSVDKFSFKWMRLSADYEVKNRKQKKKDKTGVEVEKTGQMTVVSNMERYTPTKEDIGCKLTVSLELKEGFSGYSGAVQANTTKNPVQASLMDGNEVIPYKLRHIHTAKRLESPGFRIMSYNILADCYANTEFTLDKLAPYMEKKYIDLSGHRLPLLIDEISGYNCDIVALQEVEKSTFEKTLTNRFSLNNMGGAYAQKDKQKDGVAIFYCQNRFKFIRQQICHPKNCLLSVQSIEKQIGYNIGSDGVKIPDHVKKWYTDGAEIMKTTAIQLLNNLISPGQVHQVVTLQDREMSRTVGYPVFLVVGNTHLYFHSMACHTRLFQIKVLHDMLVAAEKDLLKRYPEAKVTKLLLGDLNAKPGQGAVQFLQGGNIPVNHIEWYAGGREQYTGKLELSPEIKFTSAIDFSKIKFTTYVNNFIGVLDYIFFEEDKIELERYLDQPSDELVTKDIGMPSKVFPSDHIAQVVDLKWKV